MSLHTEIWLMGLPLSVSENAAYRNVPGVGRVSTKELREFKNAMKTWAMMNAKKINEIRYQMASNKAYHVECTFCFERSRLFTKSGETKKLDVSNRIKTLHDSLCSILGIDDRAIWSFAAIKVPTKKEEEQVIVKIIPWAAGFVPPQITVRMR